MWKIVFSFTRLYEIKIKQNLVLDPEKILKVVYIIWTIEDGQTLLKGKVNAVEENEFRRATICN